MPTVDSPMFISSRLMACIAIGDAGFVHIEYTGREELPRGRMRYGCVITATGGEPLYEGDGIRSGVGDPVDYTKAMATTLHFIAHDGENYHSCMGDWDKADEDHEPLFNRAVAEWAYLNYDEITMVAYDLDPDS